MSKSKGRGSGRTRAATEWGGHIDDPVVANLPAVVTPVVTRLGVGVGRDGVHFGLSRKGPGGLGQDMIIPVGLFLGAVAFACFVDNPYVAGLIAFLGAVTGVLAGAAIFQDHRYRQQHDAAGHRDGPPGGPDPGPAVQAFVVTEAVEGGDAQGRNPTPDRS